MDTYFDNSTLFIETPHVLSAFVSSAGDKVSCGWKPSDKVLSPLAMRARECIYKLQAQKTAFFEVFRLFISGDASVNPAGTGFVTALQWAEVVYEDLRCKDAMLQRTYMYELRQEAGYQERTKSRMGGGIRDGLRSFANAIRLPLSRRGDRIQTEVISQSQADDNQKSDVNTENDHETQIVCSTETKPSKTDEDKKKDPKPAPRPRRGFLRRIRHVLSRLCRRN